MLQRWPAVESGSHPVVSDEQLRAAAEAVRERAYAPYSHFRVGAAIRLRDGRVCTGCNVENAAYGVGLCAERVALGAAVAMGGMAVGLDCIAIASDAEHPVAPCGACRQALAELGPEMWVRSYGRGGRGAEWSVRELLPAPFTQNDLQDVSG